jgi:hypothetical protein
MSEALRDRVKAILDECCASDWHAAVDALPRIMAEADAAIARAYEAGMMAGSEAGERRVRAGVTYRLGKAQRDAAVAPTASESREDGEQRMTGESEHVVWVDVVSGRFVRCGACGYEWNRPDQISCRSCDADGIAGALTAPESTASTPSYPLKESADSFNAEAEHSNPAAPADTSPRLTRALNAILSMGEATPAVAPQERQAWGDEVRYLTDDRDQEGRMELVILQGGNGDWYIGSVPEGESFFGRLVRLCTSGGADTTRPGLTVAVSQAYRAMRGEPLQRIETAEMYADLVFGTPARAPGAPQERKRSDWEIGYTAGFKDATEGPAEIARAPSGAPQGDATAAAWQFQAALQIAFTAKTSAEWCVVADRIRDGIAALSLQGAPAPTQRVTRAMAATGALLAAPEGPPAAWPKAPNLTVPQIDHSEGALNGEGPPNPSETPNGSAEGQGEREAVRERMAKLMDAAYDLDAAFVTIPTTVAQEIVDALSTSPAAQEERETFFRIQDAIDHATEDHDIPLATIEAATHAVMDALRALSSPAGREVGE